MFTYILLGCVLSFTATIFCKDCVKCKHYINDKYNRDPFYIRFGKCRLFPLYEPIIYDKYIVPLVEEHYDLHKPFNYSFCSTARIFRDMCGYSAKKFEPEPEETK